MFDQNDFQKIILGFSNSNEKDSGLSLTLPFIP